MMIEIDDDCLDSIMQTAIVKDYVNLTNDLKNKKDLHPDDAQAYQEVSDALMVLGGWYFYNGEFEKAVKKERKKK